MRNSGGVRNARNNSSGYSSLLNLLAESGWVERNGNGLRTSFSKQKLSESLFSSEVACVG